MPTTAPMPASSFCADWTWEVFHLGSQHAAALLCGLTFCTRSLCQSRIPVLRSLHFRNAPAGTADTTMAPALDLAFLDLSLVAC